MAVAEDKGARTEYKRLVLFEDDLEQFLPAFFKVFNAYKKQKAQSQKAKQGFVQKSIEFPS
jgi:hypothetical protein